MKGKKLTIPILTLIFLFSISLMPLTSAIIVDADYITIYAGEIGKVDIEVDNSEDFDMEDVSIQLVLNTVLPDGTPISLPFTVIGSSEKDLDDLDEGDDDSVSFQIRASTDIVPGDYQIPYEVRYTNVDEDDKDKKTGTFGIRVSAKTELDFIVETRENAIVGQEGRVSLEIVNKGLGDIKSVYVQIFPEGFELLSKDKVFVGKVSSEDTDVASFDVIYKTTNPTLKAKITYKDFDNKEHTETVDLNFKVYTTEEAIEKGLIKKNNTGKYVIFIIIIIIIWAIYRKIKKRRNSNKRRA